MAVNALITGVLILLGMGVMCLAVWGTRGILALVRQSQYQRGWRTLFFLMIFFAVGYLAALLLVVLDLTHIVLVLTGVIFFFGALFVYIVVRIGYLTILELVNTQTHLAAARDEAVEASRLKSELLARVSHELRTPLHAILGYADMLASGVHGSLSDKQERTVMRIAVNTDKLVTDINHLLQQAQIESGQFVLHQEPIRLADLLVHVRLVVEPLAAKKGLALVCETADHLPSTILGDQLHLQQILTNLAGNAVKFTENGRVTITLSQPDEQHWAIQVSDTGVGIPAQAVATIFEPFHQADGSITRQYGGTGLGLSIVKQLTELMDGQISVQSEAGEGTTFTIVLPLTAAQIMEAV